MAEGRSPSSAARLLKTLVVAGASLGVSGCGGESRRTLDGASGTGGAPGTAGVGGGSGMSAAAGLGSGGRAGESAMPTAGYTGDVEDCPYAQRVCTCTYEPALIVSCTFLHPLGNQMGSNSIKLAGMTCECDRSRPAAPEDCAYTQQFTCEAYAPEYEECVCNVEAPRSKEECGQKLFQCVESLPMIGCRCVVPIR